MLAFGTAITDDDAYRRWGLAGIRVAAEPDSVVLERRSGSLQAAYNDMLEEAGGLPDLEALVLLHQDTELRDARLAPKVREVLRDQEVGLLGASGARDVRSLLWSRGERVGRLEFGHEGVVQQMRFDPPGGACPVEAVDGFLLVLSPWAVRELRFDTRFAPWFHGYDIDFSFQVRARGRKVVVVTLDAVHWAAFTALDPREHWIEASVAWQRKWDPRVDA